MRITYFPKSAAQSFGIVTVTPDTYLTAKKYMTWIIGSGIGERGDGYQAALEKIVNWGGFANIKNAVDQYGFVLVFVNTANNYEKGEYQYALQWADRNLSVDPDNICLLTHSLGGFGAGNYALPDPAFTSKINIWFNSASGPYSNSTFYENLVANKVKIWGVTAINDTASNTNPIAVTRIYEKVKALNPNANAILTTFPASEWPNDYPVAKPTGSKKAHNAVLNRLTAVPMYYSAGNLAKITKGIPEGDIKMNLWEWMLSNPRGSIYQPPTLPFTGPKYKEEEPLPIPEPLPLPQPEPQPEPIPEPTEPTPTPEPPKKIKRLNITGKKILVAPQYEDGSPGELIEVTEVDSVKLANGKFRFTLKSGKTVLSTIEV